MLAHIDLFAGYGGFGLGLGAAGIAQTVAWSEVERNACDVMRFRHPDAYELGDIQDVTGGMLRDAADPDRAIVTAGSPCQNLSIANVTRDGLAGKESMLFHEYARVLKEFQPAWTIWENVPGALTSNGGRDFGAVVRSLAECGYVLAWRILDLQGLGVPQRRRRLFLVGRRASFLGPEPCEVLALCPGCGRHPGADQPVREVSSAPSREGAADRKTVYVKSRRAQSREDYETWKIGVVAPTLNLFDNASEKRATVLVTDSAASTVRRLAPCEHESLMGIPVGWTGYGSTASGEERGLADSARIRLCGNGVSPAQVEWVARGL